MVLPGKLTLFVKIYEEMLNRTYGCTLVYYINFYIF